MLNPAVVQTFTDRATGSEFGRGRHSTLRQPANLEQHPLVAEHLHGHQGQREPSLRGVATDRHEGTGVMVLNDGHAEARVDKNINPPVDLAAGSPKGLTKSWFWDPVQRGGK